MLSIRGAVRRLTAALVVVALAVAVMAVAGSVDSIQSARADTAPSTGTPVTMSADGLPTVQVNGIVWAQVTIGDIVYATGNFTKARPAGVAIGTNETAVGNILAYTVTQADLDNGQVVDSATSTGTPPTGPPVTSPPSPPVTVPAVQTPGLTTVKSASPSTVTAAGQTVTYTFTVTNTGNVSLTSVAPTDTQIAPAGALATAPACQALTVPAAACSGASTSLLPGQVATFAATYTTTQADVDNGTVDDTATSTGTTPPGPSGPGTVITSPPSPVSVPVTQAPALTTVKSAAPSSVSAVGDVITDTFVVTNTGNVTLTGVAPTDTQNAPAGPLTTAPVCQALTTPAATCTGPTTTLLPGQVATFTATYTITQADVDHQTAIHNSATATGTTPSGPGGPGGPVTSPPSTTGTHVDATGSFTVAKSGIASGTGTAGDVVTWSITVTNTGTTTLTDLHVVDPTAGPVSCPSATVPPGASEVCSVPAHTITGAEAGSGSITNIATATGSGGAGGTSSSHEATATVITTATTPLAFTGIIGLGTSLLAGTVMLVLGLALLVLAGRRRRRTR